MPNALDAVTKLLQLYQSSA